MEAARCPCSIRQQQLSQRLLEQGLLRGCLCSLMFPLVSEDWKCWVWSLQNDQSLPCSSLEPMDGVLCGKGNRREGGGLTLVSVYVIAALSNDFGHVLCSGWPLEYGTWVWMASVLSHHISAYLYGQTKCGSFQSRIWFQSCLDGYLPSYLLVSSTQ